jgi:hypothetical protein
VFARLRQRQPDTVVLPVELGTTDLTTTHRTVAHLLRNPNVRVVVDVQKFTYFDEGAVLGLTELAESSNGRVQVTGLEGFAAAMLPADDESATPIDVRDRIDRAVTVHHNVTVVELVIDGRPLTDAEVDAVLERAVVSGRRIVTVDMRALAELTPSVQLALAELSGELSTELRTLLLVNVGTEMAAQLRMSGMTGGVHLAVEEPPSRELHW